MELSHSITDLSHQIEINRHKPVKHVRSHELTTRGKKAEDRLAVHRTRSSSSNLKNSLLHLTSCALLKRKTSRNDQSSTETEQQIQSVESPNTLTRTFSSSPSSRKSRHTQRISSTGSSNNDQENSTMSSLKKYSKKKKSSRMSSDSSVPTSPHQNGKLLIDDISSMLIKESSSSLRKELSSSLANLMINAAESMENDSTRNVKTQQALRHILSMPAAPIDRTSREIFSPTSDPDNTTYFSARPSNDFTWCYETPFITEHDDRTNPQLEIDEKPLIYRQQFQCEHFNWYGISELYGPVIISYKYFLDENKQRSLMGIIRTRQRTSVETLIDLPSSITPIEILRQLCDQCCINDIEYFDPILADGTQEFLIKYDESLVSNQHKFGIIYQRENQSTEEEIFSNEFHSSSMEIFLNLIGKCVKLKDFRGFRGGLDVKSDQTGIESIYTEFENHEIMFHVSTLLPHSKIERQQLERKRHIGNDIVAIIFQEKSTTFNPEWIASQFLHVYLIIRPIEETNPLEFEVNVIHRDTVPSFGPKFEHSNRFRLDSTFRRWLCTKLINAEIAACRSTTFQKYQERTKLNLFENLYRTLRENNRPIMDFILHQSQYKHECDLQQEHRDTFERHYDNSIFGSVRRRFITPKLRHSNNVLESKSKNRSLTMENRSSNQTKSTGKLSSSLKSSTIRSEKSASNGPTDQFESAISEMTNATSKLVHQLASPTINGQCTMFHFNGISTDEIEIEQMSIENLQNFSKEDLIKFIENFQEKQNLNRTRIHGNSL